MAVSPAGANVTKKDRKTGWSRFRLAQLGAAFLLSTGVLSAAVAVAAAREPDPMDAYGPPAAQISVSIAPVDTAEVDSAIDTTVTPTATSSTVESPEMVASSWSMSPLPEGEGGTVTSSTSVDPITPSSSMVASPQ